MAQQAGEFSSYYSGNRYDFRLTHKQLLNTPAGLEDEPNPPLSPRTAQSAALSYWKTLFEMHKPNIRVTKWLKDIPVEAVCPACSGVSFKVTDSSHRPNRDEYARSLQSQFDEHLKLLHADESGTQV